jgi:SchA/CurD like domain
MERYAICFTCKPGTEEEVAKLLSEYDRPVPYVDEDTQLLSTTIFMHGNTIVRVLDIEGDLIKAVGHLSQQPAIQDVEAKLTPYLEEPRDMSDPESAAAFFMKAMMTRVTHREAGKPKR